MSSPLDDLPLCMFGKNCYRTCEKHKKMYQHISDEDTTEDTLDSTQEVPKTDNNRKRKSSLPDSTPIKKSNNDCIAKVSEEKIDDSTIYTVPKSPENMKENLKEKFLVDLPEDFFDFFKFCNTLNSTYPMDALFSELKLTLCGPYDILSGKYKKFTIPVECWLTHCRYFHDPPEMLTIISGDPDSQFHLGYFRDIPEKDPIFVVSAETSKSGALTKLGPNLFAAINTLIESYAKKPPSLKLLQEKLQKFAKEHNYSLEKISKEMKARDKESVCKTLHGAGMVVPVDENEVGYREVPLSNKELVSLLDKIVSAKSESERNERYGPLDEVVTYIQFANDEGDFGEGLELGLSMLAFHPRTSLENSSILNEQIKSLMSLAYQLLKRPAFEQIINAHMDNRRSEL